MAAVKEISGIAVTKSDLTEQAEKVIREYQRFVLRSTGATISRAKAVVAILERYQVPV
jgi:tRNA pseudouridine-54 N-methylase